MLTKKFKVTDPHGAILFSADRDQVVVGSNSLRIEGEGGVIFKEAIQTSLIRAEASKELK